MVDFAVRCFGSKAGPERLVAPTRSLVAQSLNQDEGTSRMGLIVGEGT